jgi:acetyltransferase-like isoleucine patch superfamily enzyme
MSVPKIGRSLFLNAKSVLYARWYLRNATLLAKNVRVSGKMHVHNQGDLIIHDKVRIVSTITPTELVVGPYGKLIIGRNTFINYGCSIAANELIEIGPYCNIGTYVLMMDNDYHNLDPDKRLEMPESRPIILEENVWLGSHAIVLRGVRIGSGSVVAAGSVVTKNVLPRTLVAGVPAKIIKEL